ncbi:MAG TPA: extracellular solute-binding protein [Chloroflexota bacterium]|jgi:iron(III) transport system substrate-binding protein
MMTRTHALLPLLLVGLVAACAGPSAAPRASGAAPAAPAAPAASAPPGNAAPAAVPEGWDALVAAARQEGAVQVGGPQGLDFRRVLVDDFQQAYPGIKVEYVPGRHADIWPRMQAERAAGRYLWDIFIGGGNTTPQTLKPAGAAAALEPALVLPEVRDPAAWFDHRLWWADAEEPYTTLSFQGNVNVFVVYNKQLVDPAQISSYRDLLDPRWKGKIVATDVRATTIGAQPVRFVHANPALGPDFLEHLFGDTELTLGTDQRQLIDWLSDGQFAFGLFLSPNAVLQAIEQGLPIDFVPSERFAEGASIGASSGAINLIEPAPHPNAAKVFVNWLLSREGQLAWQREVKAPSLRTDIPKDGVYPALIPQPGRGYVDASTAAFYPAEEQQRINELITRALEKAKR